ncbi:MAG: cytochrome c biogenesis protein CcsA [Gammaproteobacteria bacterium]|nr:cytochrome c biogenesis protein CcsA [Gammaproteobacteria bacterium]
MNTSLLIEIAIAVVAYDVAAVWLFLRARKGADAAAVTRTPAHLAAAIALIAHALALQAVVHRPLGLDLGWIPMFSVMAWQIALLNWLGSFRRGTANLGIGIYPIVALGVLALAFRGTPDKLTTHMSWPLEAHILLSILAYGLLGLAAFQSILLFLQERGLRRHRPGGLLRALPPLAVMEQLLFQTLVAGFALLSLALFSGLIFVENLFAQHLAHKTFLSILAWVVFAVLLWGRWKFGWRGRIAIRWTLGGFALLVLAYFGSKLVLEVLKGTHWG